MDSRKFKLRKNLLTIKEDNVSKKRPYNYRKKECRVYRKTDPQKAYYKKKIYYKRTCKDKENIHFNIKTERRTYQNDVIKTDSKANKYLQKPGTTPKPHIDIQTEEVQYSSNLFFEGLFKDDLTSETQKPLPDMNVLERQKNDQINCSDYELKTKSDNYSCDSKDFALNLKDSKISVEQEVLISNSKVDFEIILNKNMTQKSYSTKQFEYPDLTNQKSLNNNKPQNMIFYKNFMMSKEKKQSSTSISTNQCSSHLKSLETEKRVNEAKEFRQFIAFDSTPKKMQVTSPKRDISERFLDNNFLKNINEDDLNKFKNTQGRKFSEQLVSNSVIRSITDLHVDSKCFTNTIQTDINSPFAHNFKLVPIVYLEKENIINSSLKESKINDQVIINNLSNKTQLSSISNDKDCFLDCLNSNQKPKAKKFMSLKDKFKRLNRLKKMRSNRDIFNKKTLVIQNRFESVPVQYSLQQNSLKKGAIHPFQPKSYPDQMHKCSAEHLHPVNYNTNNCIDPNSKDTMFYNTDANIKNYSYQVNNNFGQVLPKKLVLKENSEFYNCHKENQGYPMKSHSKYQNTQFFGSHYNSNQQEGKNEDFSNKYKTEICKNFELTNKCQWGDMVRQY